MDFYCPIRDVEQRLAEAHEYDNASNKRARDILTPLYEPTPATKAINSLV